MPRQGPVLCRGLALRLLEGTLLFEETTHTIRAKRQEGRGLFF